MEKSTIVIIAILIFFVFTYLFWTLTSDYAKKEYGKKLWKRGATRLAYWEAAVLYSSGLTCITPFVLNWASVLTF